MATDTTLVQGAYDASRYRGQAVDAAQRRFADNLNETVGKLAANKRKVDEIEKKEVDTSKKKAEDEEKERLSQLDTDFSEASEKFLNSGSLDEANYSATHDFVNSWKDGFINGTPKDQSQIMNRINNLSGDVASYRGTMEAVATAQKEGDFSNSVSPEKKEWYKKLLNGEITLSPKQSEGEDGEQSYEMGIINENGEWMSQSALTNSFDEGLIDNNSISTVQNLGVSQAKLGKENNEVPFDPSSVIGGINTMIKNGNINSLVSDEILGDGSGTFADHLRQEKNLTNLRFDNLGVSDQHADELDKNKDGIINEGELSQDDIDGIVYEFTNNPSNKDALKEELKNYFTQFAKTNYEKGQGLIKEAEESTQRSGNQLP